KPKAARDRLALVPGPRLAAAGRSGGFCAENRFVADAPIAMSAGGPHRKHHADTFRQSGHAQTQSRDRSRRFMSKDGGRRERHATIDDAEIGMTDATVTNATENLAGARIIDLDPFDDVQSPAGLGENS